MPSWKKVITSGSDAELHSLNVTTNVVAQSFTGSLYGTSSWASHAITASYITTAQTASYVLNAISSSYATSASYVPTTPTFPYTGSALITGSLGITGSLNTKAQGALSTDIVFNIRNSSNTGNLLNLVGSTQFIFGSSTTTPEGLLLAQNDFGSAQPILTLRNGQYGNLIFQVRDERTSSAGSVGSIRINGIIYGGESATTKQLDLGGHGLGTSYGGNSSNAVWLNDQGNVDDGAGSSVISVSSNLYINSQTNKRFLFKPSSANFGINQLTFGTNATNTLAIASGTAPTTSPTDAIQFYSNDITAGNAAPHFRTENGSIIKLYQQGAVSSSQGLADVLTNLGLLTGSSTITTATSSYAVSSSYALSASYAPAAATGPFGIADSSGSYTYYSTLSASMAAATSGQTVEMFADYTETGAVTISLKDGVNLNGNGHTYTCTYSSTSITLFENTTGTQNVSNLTIYGNGVHSSTNGFVITYTANKTFFDGVVIKMTAGVAAYVYGVSTIEGLICNVTGNARGFYVDSGNIIDCKSFSVNGYSIFTINNASVYDSYANSTSTSAFYLNTGAVYNCTGIGNIGIESQGGSMYNSIGLSNSGYGIYLQPAVTAAKVTNCTAISNASWGMFMYSNNALVVNCTIISTANNGIYSQFVSGCKLSNNYINSSAAIAVRLNAANASFNNNHIECTWNNSGGHAFQAGQSGDILCGNVFEVTNASANGLNAGSAITTKYIDSKFVGATIAVNSNITQATINTQDNYGNIII